MPHIIISGHRRYEAAKKLHNEFSKKPDKKSDEKPNPKWNFNELPVTVSDLTDDIAIREAIIEFNENRTKTKEQILREYKEIERVGAKQRQGTRKDFQEKFPGSKKGQARDLAAVKFGMSGKTADSGVKVIDAIDREDEEIADELRKSLNTKGVHRAFKKAQEEGLVIDEEMFAEMRGELENKPAFNATTKGIDWARWSWNPLTGCEQGCPYCYARNIANRFDKLFPKGFEIDYREERLKAPQNEALIKRAENLFKANKGDIRYKTVFVCSMGDLFGKSVSEEYIKKVLETIQNSPKWNFSLLTKCPENMAKHIKQHESSFKFTGQSYEKLKKKGLPEEILSKLKSLKDKLYKDETVFVEAIEQTIGSEEITEYKSDIVESAQNRFPDNVWAGTTIDKKSRIRPAIKAFREIEATVKQIYCEPLLEDLASDSSMYTLLELVDWVVIGAQTKTKDVPAKQPQWEWVVDLVNQAREAGCLVYFKDNLKPMLYEYPRYYDALQTRLTDLKGKLSEEAFDNVAKQWDHIEFRHNGGKEYIQNYEIHQMLEREERKLEEELKKKSNGDKKLTAKENNTASEEKKFDSSGKGSESDVREEELKNEGNGNGKGEEDKIDSTEEPAESPASVN